MARRLPIPLVAALAALLVSFLPASATADPLRPHPYFRDAGTLDWRTSLDEAAAAARSSGRLIFIEYGRRKCGNCRATVETILPSSTIKARVSALCVGLAAECDTPDPRVEALFARWLPTASILPFCALVTADLRWVDGWAGLIGTSDCLRRVAAAEPVCARWRAVAAATAPTCARSGKGAVVVPPPAPPPSSATGAARPVTSATPPAPAPLGRPAPFVSPTLAPPAPSAPEPSLDGGLGAPDEAGCDGEDGEMECKGGTCRLVRRAPAAPAEAPDAVESEPLAAPEAAQPLATAGEPAAPAEAPADAPPMGLAIAPTAPRQTMAHAPTGADWAVAREILARAVSAAGRDAYGEVIRLHGEAARLPVVAEPMVWNDLHARAEAWIRGRVAATVTPPGPRPASTR